MRSLNITCDCLFVFNEIMELITQHKITHICFFVVAFFVILLYIALIPHGLYSIQRVLILTDERKKKRNSPDFLSLWIYEKILIINTVRYLVKSLKVPSHSVSEWPFVMLFFSVSVVTLQLPHSSPSSYHGVTQGRADRNMHFRSFTVISIPTASLLVSSGT